MVVLAGRAPRGWQNLASQPLVWSVCLQIEKLRLYSLDQPFGGTFQRGKKSSCILWETLSSENIPLSSSELKHQSPG